MAAMASFGHLENPISLTVCRHLTKQELTYFAGAPVVLIEERADALMLHLRAKIFVTGLEESRRFEQVPVTWWDAAKQRFFPSWLLRRFPAKTREIATEIVVLRPYAPTAALDDTPNPN